MSTNAEMMALTDAVLAELPMSDDGTGHVADCGFDLDAMPTCGCYDLRERIAKAIEPFIQARVAGAYVSGAVRGLDAEVDQ